MAWRAETATTGASGSTPTVTKPTGLANGDTALIVLVVSGSTTPPAAPSGFSQIASAVAASNPRVYLYAKAITNAGGEPASWAFGATIATAYGIRATAFVGGDPSTILDVAAVVVSNVTSDPLTQNITPATDGAGIYSIIAGNSSSRTLTDQSSPWTNGVLQGERRNRAAWRDGSGTGVHSITWDWSGSISGASGILVAIKPAPSGSPGTLTVTPAAATAQAEAVVLRPTPEAWRFYTDATPDGSMTALGAAALVAPTLTGAQCMNGTIRLRVQLTSSVTALHVEYSLNGTDWAGIPDADNSGVSNAQNRWFTWANGAATAGGTIGSRLLAQTAADGKYIESRGQTATVSGGARTEFDLALRVRWPVPDQTIQLRLLDNTTPITLPDGAPTITLESCAVADRLWTIDVAGPSTSDGQNREYGLSAWNQTVYADGAWWFFTVQPADDTNLSYWRWDGSGPWDARQTVAMGASSSSTSETDVRHTTAFATISGTPLMASFIHPSSGNMRYRRGRFVSGAVTWDSLIDLGTARGNAFNHNAIDEGGYHWIGGINGTSGIWACRSTAADDGSGSFTVAFGTISSRRKTLAATVANGTRFAIVPIASDAALCFWNAGSDLFAAKVTDAGGFGSAVQVNTTTDAHPDDWGVTRMGGSVYAVHSDSTATGGTVRTRVYSIAGDSWSAGTDPGAAQPTQNSNADGLVATNDGTNVHIFGTGVGPEGGQDRSIWSATFNGSTWSGPTVITPNEGRGNGDDISGPPAAGNGKIVIAYLFGDDDITNSFAHEYHVLTLGATASLTVTAATATAQSEAVTLDAASNLTVTAATATAAAQGVTFDTAATLAVTPATATTAAGGVTFDAASALAITAATATAAAQAVNLAAAAAATLTVGAATATAQAEAVTIDAAARLVLTQATATAQGEAVAFDANAAASLAVTAATATAQAEAVVLGAAASASLVVTAATAAAQAEAVTLDAAARLTATAATATAQAEAVTLDRAARMIAGTATATAQGQGVTFDAAARLVLAPSLATAAAGSVALGAGAAAGISVTAATATAQAGAVTFDAAARFTAAPATATAQGQGVTLDAAAVFAIAAAIASGQAGGITLNGGAVFAAIAATAAAQAESAALGGAATLATDAAAATAQAEAVILRAGVLIVPTLVYAAGRPDDSPIAAGSVGAGTYDARPVGVVTYD